MNPHQPTRRAKRLAQLTVLLTASLAGPAAFSAPATTAQGASLPSAVPATPATATTTSAANAGSSSQGSPAASTQAPKKQPFITATEETNLWPLLVSRRAPDGSTRKQSAGPFLFSDEAAAPTGTTTLGFRPLWLDRHWPSEQRREVNFLYPLFTYRSTPGYRSWSVLNLINHRLSGGNNTAAESEGFDLWPFWFSRTTPDPDASYKALFPLVGTIKNRFYNDRINWVVWPLYARYQKAERVTTTAPWPFVRWTHGGGHHGWAVWPLVGHRSEEGRYSKDYWLWPFAYRSVSGLGKPEGPTVRKGLLPFYTSDRGPGLDSRIYAWPFFGYTHRTQPARYDETRYFWPLFLQGRGDGVLRNRWAPFYSHSEVKGVSKTWILWPFWRDQAFTEAALDQRKRQFLLFLYWDLQQRRAGAAPGSTTASKTHLWPLFSRWDNGAGRRQLQVLSPIEVFLQHNETTRQLWSPLFALYKSDVNTPTGQARRSLLWDFVSWEHSKPAQSSRFTLGPLLRTDRAPEGKRISLLCGLVGLRRTAGNSWKPFLFDFKKHPVAAAAAPAPAPAHPHPHLAKKTCVQNSCVANASKQMPAPLPRAQPLPLTTAPKAVTTP